MTDTDLSLAYNNADFIPDSAAYPSRWAREAEAFRDKLKDRAELGVPYGDGERQAIDIFHPEGDSRGLMVFVHGGYWRRFHRHDWSHFAAGALARGWAVAMPSYTLAPQARIAEITVEVATAIVAAAGRVPAGPLVVTGHSAGGHLSARMLCRDVALPDAVVERLGRVVPISPLSDLRPFLRTDLNADLRLDAAEARAESPVIETNPRAAECIVWVGAEERPAFLDQARWLSEAWGAALRIDPGRHHFDVIDGLCDPESSLMSAILDKA